MTIYLNTAVRNANLVQHIQQIWPNPIQMQFEKAADYIRSIWELSPTRCHFA